MRDILDELRKIRYARFRLEMVAIDRLRLPPYKGSTLRGAFGHAFKKLVCVKRDLDCSTCLIRDRCVYYYVFETPFGGEGEPRGYTFAPHPFVIEPPEGAQRIYEPETEFQVGLILVGRALDYLPYFIYAFEDMGRRGLGIGRGKAALKQAAALYPGEERCIYQAETGTLGVRLSHMCRSACRRGSWSAAAAPPTNPCPSQDRRRLCPRDRLCPARAGLVAAEFRSSPLPLWG